MGESLRYTNSTLEPKIGDKVRFNWSEPGGNDYGGVYPGHSEVKIGKSGMKTSNKSSYDKMTIAKLINYLQSLPKHDREIVIYPKYTGSDCQSDSKYRFTITEMQDQWHQNYPYIALMF